MNSTRVATSKVRNSIVPGLSSQIIRRIDDHHAQLINRMRHGHMIVPGETLYVLECEPAGYAPLAAMICRAPIAEKFWGPAAENPGFVEGHTFEGSPVACAAGIAVLEEILERDLLPR